MCSNIDVQKLAIKKMTLQATKEFMAELKVLTNVHHTNLVGAFLLGFKAPIAEVGILELNICDILCDIFSCNWLCPNVYVKQPDIQSTT